MLGNYVSMLGAGTPVTNSDWATVITALTDQVSVATVVGVLAAAVGAGVGLVFMWWGLRKMVRMIMAAFKRGKLSV